MWSIFWEGAHYILGSPLQAHTECYISTFGDCNGIGNVGEETHLWNTIKCILWGRPLLTRMARSLVLLRLVLPCLSQRKGAECPYIVLFYKKKWIDGWRGWFNYWVATNAEVAESVNMRKARCNVFCFVLYGFEDCWSLITRLRTRQRRKPAWRSKLLVSDRPTEIWLRSKLPWDSWLWKILIWLIILLRLTGTCSLLLTSLWGLVLFVLVERIMILASILLLSRLMLQLLLLSLLKSPKVPGCNCNLKSVEEPTVGERETTLGGRGRWWYGSFLIKGSGSELGLYFFLVD